MVWEGKSVCEKFPLYTEIFLATDTMSFHQSPGTQGQNHSQQFSFTIGNVTGMVKAEMS